MAACDHILYLISIDYACFILLSGIMQQDNSEQVIINPRLIARHYIGTWFFLDLISSIPLDYILLIFNSIRGSDVSFICRADFRIISTSAGVRFGAENIRRE